MAIKGIEYKGTVFEISYEIVNPKKSKSILFLHGWGSNKETMSASFKHLFLDFRHIYIDLPGFGKSTNNMVLNTHNYRDILELFLKDFELFAIFGHSFGGKIATLLNPNILVLLSSAGIVTKKSLDVRAKIVISKTLKHIFKDRTKNIFVTKDAKNLPPNMYETLKNVVDEPFDHHFLDFKNRALIFWGESDRQTPLESGQKIASLIEDSKFKKMSGDHFFFLKNNKEIENIFLKEII